MVVTSDTELEFCRDIEDVEVRDISVEFLWKTERTETAHNFALLKTGWSTLIGRDPRDIVFSLVEPYFYAGAKVYAITIL